MNNITKYKKFTDYSYTLGAFTTMELLSAKANHVRSVVVHSKYNDSDKILSLCLKQNIPVVSNDRVISRLSEKENVYVLGVFNKYKSALSETKPHVVLVNPSSMGNLGTSMRTLAGFNICDLAIITPSADVWNPKTVRASMGSLFRINIEMFSSFEEYTGRFRHHILYPFMSDGDIILTPDFDSGTNLYSLIFGNEATGLPEIYNKAGTSIKIPQSEMIDSLNISVALGIGVYVFNMCKNKNL